MQAKRLGIPGNKIEVISNGVDLDLFHPNTEGQSIRDRYGVKDHLILAVGSLRRLKGIQYPIRAIPDIIDDLGSVMLLVVGDGPYKSTLLSIVEELGIGRAVEFAGHVSNEELPPFYAAADLVVVPSLDEAFGVVALEAMAAGKPVVASRVGGLVEVLGEESGMLVPPADPRALGSAIVGILRDERKRKTLGIAARSRAEDLFDAKERAADVLALYKSLVG